MVVLNSCSNHLTRGPGTGHVDVVVSVPDAHAKTPFSVLAWASGTGIRVRGQHPPTPGICDLISYNFTNKSRRAMKLTT